ncbi:MAG: hypothetical protein ACI8XV_002764 [Arenicella sp.]|jgi:hypothetical protein
MTDLYVYYYFTAEYSTITNRYSVLTPCVYLKQELRQPLTFIET